MTARIDHVSGDDDVGRGEDALALLGVAGLPHRGGEVVGLIRLVVSDQRRIGIEGLPRVDHRGQGVVLDVDQGQGVARRIAVLGDHEGNLLALEPHLVAGEDGL
jgi:hypothetical protein